MECGKAAWLASCSPSSVMSRSNAFVSRAILIGLSVAALGACGLSFTAPSSGCVGDTYSASHCDGDVDVFTETGSSNGYCDPREVGRQDCRSSGRVCEMSLGCVKACSTNGDCAASEYCPIRSDRKVCRPGERVNEYCDPGATDANNQQRCGTDHGAPLVCISLPWYDRGVPREDAGGDSSAVADAGLPPHSQYTCQCVTNGANGSCL